MKKAIFLDRDGVLNEAVVREGRPYPPSSLATTRIVRDAPRALAALRQAGYLLIVVTNQPDVARGLAQRDEVESINKYLQSTLDLDDVRTCFHDTPDGCQCRKPKPGALLGAALNHGIDLTRSWMIGDRWSDIEAGRLAGCQTVFLQCNYSEAQPSDQTHTAKTLLEASNIITGVDR